MRRDGGAPWQDLRRIPPGRFALDRRQECKSSVKGRVKAGAEDMMEQGGKWRIQVVL